MLHLKDTLAAILTKYKLMIIWQTWSNDDLPGATGNRAHSGGWEVIGPRWEEDDDLHDDYVLHDLDDLDGYDLDDDDDDDYNHDHDDGGDCVNCLGGDDSEDKGKTKRLTLTRALSLTTKPQNMQGDAPLCRVWKTLCKGPIPYHGQDTRVHKS